VTIAVIGDVPYGLEQGASLPTLVDAVNEDPKVRLVAHVGDIKSGSTTCTDGRNVRWIESQVAFPTLHVIGSNNGHAPWSGLGFAAPTAEQAVEVNHRMTRPSHGSTQPSTTQKQRSSPASCC